MTIKIAPAWPTSDRTASCGETVDHSLIVIATKINTIVFMNCVSGYFRWFLFEKRQIIHFMRRDSLGCSSPQLSCLSFPPNSFFSFIAFNIKLAIHISAFPIEKSVLSFHCPSRFTPMLHTCKENSHPCGWVANGNLDWGCFLWTFCDATRNTYYIKCSTWHGACISLIWVKSGAARDINNQTPKSWVGSSNEWLGDVQRFSSVLWL